MTKEGFRSKDKNWAPLEQGMEVHCKTRAIPLRNLFIAPPIRGTQYLDVVLSSSRRHSIR